MDQMSICWCCVMVLLFFVGRCCFSLLFFWSVVVGCTFPSCRTFLITLLVSLFNFASQFDFVFVKFKFLLTVELIFRYFYYNYFAICFLIFIILRKIILIMLLFQEEFHLFELFLKQLFSKDWTNSLVRPRYLYGLNSVVSWYSTLLYLSFSLSSHRVLFHNF